MITNHKLQEITLHIPAVAIPSPLELEGYTHANHNGRVYKVQKHHLGLCVGCHGHIARLCDKVKCYELGKASTYRLVDIALPKTRKQPKLGE